MLLRIVYPLVYAFISIFFPFKISGREKIPEGAAMICANHTSYLDVVYIYIALGRKSKNHAMAKKELFRFPVFSTVIGWLGAFPVSRDGSDIGALKRSLKVLSSGERLIIFPEGRRVAENDQTGAKGGAGMIAMRAGCPVVPVYIPGEKRLFRRTVITVGEPFYVEKPAARPDREDYQKASDEIYSRIFSMRSGE